MNFLEFQEKLFPYPVFSLKNVQTSIPRFSYRQLDRWCKKGYLCKIRRGYYSLRTVIKNDHDQAVHESSERFLYYLANTIYSPSYISLEKALKFYGLIPEEVFQITSVSTKKTNRFKTPFGNISYQHIKPSLFFGYQLLEFGPHKILMSDPEKALLDTLYLNPKLQTIHDFEEMRIDKIEFQEQVNLEKFNIYLHAFENQSLVKRAKLFLKAVIND